MSEGLPMAVLGTGAFGTVMADLAARKGHAVRLWGRREAACAAIREKRENPEYLPGVPLAETIGATTDLALALRGARLVILAIPAQSLREVARRAAPLLPGGAALLSLAKGIEEATLARPSEILVEEFGPEVPTACLSGPSFASELARGRSTLVAVAARDMPLAAWIQTMLRTSYFRLYANPDLVGVELGGALKNVVVIGLGIAQGLGAGPNTLAALVTRGLLEMALLGTALGAKKSTFFGLSGMGDLSLSVFGGLSRNCLFGKALGRGASVGEALRSVSGVVEGLPTTRAAMRLAAARGLRLPICAQVHAVLFEGRSPREALAALTDGDEECEFESFFGRNGTRNGLNGQGSPLFGAGLDDHHAEGQDGRG